MRAAERKKLLAAMLDDIDWEKYPVGVLYNKVHNALAVYGTPGQFRKICDMGVAIAPGAFQYSGTKADLKLFTNKVRLGCNK